jgi:hypothetical protein
MQWNLTKCDIDGDFTPLVRFDHLHKVYRNHLHKVYRNDTDEYRPLPKFKIAFSFRRLMQQENKTIQTIMISKSTIPSATEIVPAI